MKDMIHTCDATQLCQWHSEMMHLIRSGGASASASTAPIWTTFERYQALQDKTGMTLLSDTMRQHLAELVAKAKADNTQATACVFGSKEGASE